MKPISHVLLVALSLTASSAYADACRGDQMDSLQGDLRYYNEKIIDTYSCAFSDNLPGARKTAQAGGEVCLVKAERNDWALIGTFDGKAGNLFGGTIDIRAQEDADRIEVVKREASIKSKGILGGFFNPGRQYDLGAYHKANLDKSSGTLEFQITDDQRSPILYRVSYRCVKN